EVVCEGAIDGEREIAGRCEGQLVAGGREGDEAVEQVVAVGAPADDVEVEVDLGGSGDAKRRRRSSRAHGPEELGSPRSSFVSIGATWSLSGLRLRARCHWKRASLWRPTRQ